ncbi:hypothetical protein J6590_039738 [Homalodisca vitripennis]|nr:hypothetical protein J6590_039738 [Homalodisca vitripennis]
MPFVGGYLDEDLTESSQPLIQQNNGEWAQESIFGVRSPRWKGVSTNNLTESSQPLIQQNNGEWAQESIFGVRSPRWNGVSTNSEYTLVTYLRGL